MHDCFKHWDFCNVLVENQWNYSLLVLRKVSEDSFRARCSHQKRHIWLVSLRFPTPGRNAAFLISALSGPVPTRMGIQVNRHHLYGEFNKKNQPLVLVFEWLCAGSDRQLPHLPANR